MEGDKKISFKEEPEVEGEDSNEHQSFPYVDEDRNVKFEDEIHLLGVLPLPRIILKKIKIEDEDQSESKTNSNNGKKNFQCEKCLKCFAWKKVLERHQKVHEDERDSYDCDQCSKSFDKRAKLASHKRAHQERNIKCNKCEQLFKSKAAFVMHQKSHEIKMPKVSAKCAVCNKKFKDKYILKTHMILHRTDRKIYSCDHCESKFKRKEQLSIHIRTKHIQFEKKFFCDHCPKSFSHKDLLRKHIIHHMTECCKICCKKMNKTSLIVHIKDVHGDHLQQLAILKLKCPICPKMFQTKKNLKLHIATHEKKLKCKMCDQKFARNQHLTAHMKWHKNPSKFSCDLCYKSFETSKSLHNHKNAVHGEKKYACDKCAFRAFYYKAIVSHMKSHLRKLN